MCSLLCLNASPARRVLPLARAPFNRDPLLRWVRSSAGSAGCPPSFPGSCPRPGPAQGLPCPPIPRELPSSGAGAALPPLPRELPPLPRAGAGAAPLPSPGPGLSGRERVLPLPPGSQLASSLLALTHRLLFSLCSVKQRCLNEQKRRRQRATKKISIFIGSFVICFGPYIITRLVSPVGVGDLPGAVCPLDAQVPGGDYSSFWGARAWRRPGAIPARTPTPPGEAWAAPGSPFLLAARSGRLCQE